jgi:hypothetical protein
MEKKLDQRKAATFGDLAAKLEGASLLNMGPIGQRAHLVGAPRVRHNFRKPCEATFLLLPAASTIGGTPASSHHSRIFLPGPFAVYACRGSLRGMCPRPHGHPAQPMRGVVDVFGPASIAAGPPLKFKVLFSA